MSSKMKPSEALEIIEMGHPASKLQEAEEVSRRILRDVVEGRYISVESIKNYILKEDK